MLLLIFSAPRADAQPAARLGPEPPPGPALGAATGHYQPAPLQPLGAASQHPPGPLQPLTVFHAAQPSQPDPADLVPLGKVRPAGRG